MSTMIQDTKFEPLTKLDLDPGPKLEPFNSDLTSNFNSESYKSENMEIKEFKSNLETNDFKMDQDYKPMDFSMDFKPMEDFREKKTSPEIEEGKIKNTLKEIITEIDAYAEKDPVLRESTKVEEMEVINDGVTETKIEKMSDFQKMEALDSTGKVKYI